VVEAEIFSSYIGLLIKSQFDALLNVTQNVSLVKFLIYKMLFVYQLIQISTLLLVHPDMKT
jgi:hypothetical protein